MVRWVLPTPHAHGWTWIFPWSRQDFGNQSAKTMCRELGTVSAGSVDDFGVCLSGETVNCTCNAVLDAAVTSFRTDVPGISQEAPPREPERLCLSGEQVAGASGCLAQVYPAPTGGWLTPEQRRRWRRWRSQWYWAERDQGQSSLRPRLSPRGPAGSTYAANEPGTPRFYCWSKQMGFLPDRVNSSSLHSCHKMRACGPRTQV